MSEKVKLVLIPGYWIPSDIVHPPPDSTDEDALEVINCLKPHRDSKNGKLIIIDAMPATVPSYHRDKMVEGLAPVKNEQSPYSPLSFVGIRSGRRSAIVPCKRIKCDEKNDDYYMVKDTENYCYYPTTSEDSDCFLRVKGCGMWIESDKTSLPGFTLQEKKTCHYHGEEDVYEIRGCSFERTALTEVYATNKVIQMLNKINVQCGNEPLGFYIYKSIDEDVTTDIKKACVVAKTFGDRRLETHLLAGVERIMKEVKEEELEDVVKKIKEVYNKHNTELGDKYKSYSKSIKLKRNDMSKRCSQLLNSLEDGNFEYMKNLNEIGYIPSNELIDALKDMKLKEWDLLVFAELFAQIGYECGRSIACIHRAGFSWGSYIDHDECEMHCNAHPDNMLVLTKEQAMKHKQILAPIDFDMAFESRCSVDIWSDKPKKDPTIVEDYFWVEHNNFLSDIVGLSASNVGLSTAISYREPMIGNHSILIEALRDIASWEYLHSYNSPRRERIFDVKEVYNLIQKALDYTINVNS